MKTGNNWFNRTGGRTPLIALLWLVAGGAAMAQSGSPAINPLAELSLEELSNMKVTSVSKKATSLENSPAAITVVTPDDIRRLGITSIPEALRLVPGMDVARMTGNEWAVSARGFNNEFANKLLVLIDGRTVYTATSAGVFWNGQDVMLEDLDRIEVIRGPGAALWGANAVNGVINITTKSAKDTQGLLISSSFGAEDNLPTTSVRYGGQAATNLYFRVYAKYFDRNGLVDSAGQDIRDDWNMAHGGFRLDWLPTTADNVTVQGDYYGSEAGKRVNQLTLSPASVLPVDRTEHNSGGNLLGRWTRAFSEESALTLQTYYEHVEQGNGFDLEHRNTWDVDAQHRLALGGRNDIVWGAGYRLTSVRTPSTFNLVWTPENQELHLFNVFVQDDLTLVRERLHLTLGSKFEHNNLTGWEIQPGTRLLWTPTERQTVWAAVSRAARTPAIFNRSGRLNVAAFQFGPTPSLVAVLPNPSVAGEKLTAYELGYRIEATRRLSFDATAFYNVYDDLIVQVQNPNQPEASPAPAHTLISSTWQNADAAEAYGAELSAQWQVTAQWRLSGSYSWLHMHLHPDATGENSSPRQQFQIRSYLDLPHNLELNGAVYYVDQITTAAGAVQAPVSAYVRCDAGLVWRPTKSLEVGVWGQNLLEARHSEFTSQSTTLRTEVPRGVLGKITWRF